MNFQNLRAAIIQKYSETKSNHSWNLKETEMSINGQTKPNKHILVNNQARLQGIRNYGNQE
jgi:hypothetical protein